MPRYKVRKRPLGLSKGSAGDIYVISRGNAVRSLWSEFLERERASIWQKIRRRLKNFFRRQPVWIAAELRDYKQYGS